jgi:O-methyltransferase/methyltransferase family protein
MSSTADSAPVQQGITSDSQVPPSATLLGLLAGSWLSQAIYVVAKLGIADLLAAGPAPSTTLAEITGTHAGALYRILRALASVGVFAEDDDRRFQLTPAAACLCSKTPGSLRAFAVMLGEQEHWRAWSQILHSVRTGQPAFDRVFGVSRFEYFADHPDDARTFSEAMTSRAGEENDAIIAAYDFSTFENVTDVGGGEGSLLAAILRTTSSTRCVLFDLPHVVATAKEAADRGERAVSYQFVGGSFFDPLPAGADAYVLKKVVMDWDDERAIAILTNCRAAMPRSGRILVIEPIVPSGNIASFNKLLDLLLLVWTPGGRVRTEVEHGALLSASKLAMVRVIPTGSSLGIIEAVPAD